MNYYNIWIGETCRQGIFLQPSDGAREAEIMPTIECNGVRLAYEERGAGAPAFVFVHGWTGNRSTFAPQVEYFSRERRVITLDLRGHGESEKPDGDYTIEIFANDVARLIEHLELGKVIAVGHSMGGAVVLQLAADYPHLVAGVAMLDPAPFSIPPEALPKFQAMADEIEAGHQESRQQFVTVRMFSPLSEPAFVERITAIMLSTPNHVAARAARGMTAFDGPAVAARCTVPALHIAAASPLNSPHQMSQWLPGVVHGWTVGGGHFHQIEAPEQVNAMLEAFVRCHVPGVAGQSASR